jgi:NAD(P)-dependent dehydrogenase (short-subunit alcohol dehydrogenase family)
MNANSQSRVSVVTGGSQGIGRGIAEGLAARGDEVVIVCRHEGRGRQAQAEISNRTGNPKVVLMLADLSSGAAVRALAEAITDRYPRVDVLVNNHTAIFEERRVSVDGLEMNFALNHLAYVHLTLRLLDRLRASPASRVVNVAAEVHRFGTINFDDLYFEAAYDGVTAYCQAKLGNVLFTYELARRLEGAPVTANCLHPGTVDTLALRTIRAVHHKQTGQPLSAYPPIGTLEAGVTTPLYLATAEAAAGVTGRYFIDRQPAESSEASHDRETARRLWQVSLDAAGLDEAYAREKL